MACRLSFGFLLGLVFAISCALAEQQQQWPLVSVIIPTYGRPEFVQKAIELVHRQDYPNVEVVVVDDNPNRLELPADPRLTHIHLKERKSIGAKRNLAVEKSKGQVIIHWDDDDYFREHRISAQVAPIISGEVDITVLEHHYYFHLPSRTFYTLKRANNWGPHFGTFAYNRRLFDQLGIRYPDNSLGEDYGFYEFALNKGATIKVISNDDGKHVYTRHHNTWQFDLKGYEEQVKRVDRPSFFSQKDFDFFVSVKTVPLPNPPNYFASDKIKWNRPELHPQGWIADGSPAYPYYPYYPSYNNGGRLSTVAKIAIGAGVAAAVVVIVGVGIAAYFYFQWKRQDNDYTRINEVV